MESGPDVSGAAPDVDNNAALANGHDSLDLDPELDEADGLDLGSGAEAHMHAVAAEHQQLLQEQQHNSEDLGAPSGPAFAAKTSTRRRTPTAAAVAANAQAAEAAPSKSKNARSRRKPADTSGVSRTSHGGVKIGGRAVTWVGGAGMPREVLDKMGIPQLRALFLKTFNHPTGSNNAEWLRKKLAQPRDPQVGAARAAVPRARDVGAEIWATGTTFKGFTKQERVKLQQMGGNCAAKVVEVIKDSPEDLAMKEKAFATKRRKKPIIDKTKMQIIGAEKFEMPPPKRQRAGEHNAPETGLPLDPGAAPSSLDAGEAFPGYAGDMEPYAMMTQGQSQGAPILPSQQQQQQQQWRTLEMNDTSSLRPGVNVKVYRADERWHSGVLENVRFSS